MDVQQTCPLFCLRHQTDLVLTLLQLDWRHSQNNVKTALYLPDYGNNTHHEAFSCIMTEEKMDIYVQGGSVDLGVIK